MLVDLPVPLRPPPGRWCRLNEAAARLGIPPALLAADIAAGRSGLRFMHLGARRLVHVADADLALAAAKLHVGEVAP
jgi:hypothetical protein